MGSVVGAKECFLYPSDSWIGRQAGMGRINIHYQPHSSASVLGK